MTTNCQPQSELPLELNYCLRGLLFLAFFTVSVSAQPKSPGYDYVSAGFDKFDVDETKIDGPTIGFGWLFAESLSVSGTVSKYSGDLIFQGASSEFDIFQSGIEAKYSFSNNWLINVGGQRDTNKIFGVDETSTSIKAGLGYFNETGYSYFDVILGAVSVDGDFFDTQSRDFSDNGAYAQMFYRHYPTENLEVEVQVEYFGFEQSSASGYLSLIYKNLLPFDVYGGLSLGDAEGVFAGIRLSFD